MTEVSRPFPGTTIGDAGPYSSENWWDVWGAMANAGRDTSDTGKYNVGVFYSISDKLEPSINGTFVDVEAGAALIDGLFYENDATVSVTIPAAAAGKSRIDYIVIRKNYQLAVDYTPKGAGPQVLRRTARISVIRGVADAAPVAPSLNQDATRTTYWDIPIAQVTVSDAGVLSALTDLREFVDAETKQILIPFIGGENFSDSTYLTYSNTRGITMTDNKYVRAYSSCNVPQDFIKDFYVSAVTVNTFPSNHNLYGLIDVYYSTQGEQFGFHNDSTGYSAVPVTSVDICYILKTKLNSASIGDIVSVMFARDSTNILDTVNVDVHALGMLIEYFGWKG